MQDIIKKLKFYWPQIRRFLAPTHRTSSLQERLIAALGGGLAVLLIGMTTHWLHPESTWLMVASMGASSVLLFAVPSAPMSQPWPVFGSHLLSAFFGISMALVFTDPIVMAASAITLSIFAMYSLGCLHPPGGATSLIAVMAVISGTEVGYHFLLFPVLTNLIVLIFIAVVFNNLMPNRYYPAYFAKREPIAEQETDKHTLSRTEFINALKEIDSFIDINETQLEKLIAITGITQDSVSKSTLEIGQCFSNGVTGARWSIIEVTNLIRDAQGGISYVWVKRRAGSEPEKPSFTLKEFLEWTAYEVKPAQSGWQRIR